MSGRGGGVTKAYNGRQEMASPVWHLHLMVDRTVVVNKLCHGDGHTKGSNKKQPKKLKNIWGFSFNGIL
jgi:hypothetical protein